MDALVVRDAIDGDQRALAAMHVEAHAWAYGDVVARELLASETIRSEREAMWARVLGAPEPRSATLIAERGGEGLGFVSIGASRDDDASDDTGEVHAIYLRREELAGQGVGRALMDAALERLRSAGFREATLWALVTNERARRFYERGGWRADGTTKTATLAGVPLPHARYRRAL